MPKVNQGKKPNNLQYVQGKGFKSEIQVGNITGEEVWEFQKKKSEGANGAGELGGEYVNQSTGQRALFKRDSNPAKNIAEFLASRIHRATHPDTHAEVIFARGKTLEEHPYIASIFFENYKGDLYKYAHESQASEADKPSKAPNSRPRFMGTKNLINKTFNRPIFKTAALINKILEGKEQDFAAAVVPRLLTNDMDMHSANFGMKKDEKGNERLVSLDFGEANASLDKKIHPHSHLRHLPGLGPTNHFREYGRKYKITPEFSSECDKVAKHDYKETINDAFKEIAEYNNLIAVKKFGRLMGMSSKDLAVPDKGLLTAKIQNRYQEIMEARQQDLSRFSAQIKLDLCLNNTKDGNIGSYKYQDPQGNGEIITFKDVVLAHQEYFQDILAGKEKLKFRDKAHCKNYSRLSKVVLEQANMILAQLAPTPFVDNPLYTSASAQSRENPDRKPAVNPLAANPRQPSKKSHQKQESNISFQENLLYIPKSIKFSKNPSSSKDINSSTALADGQNLTNPPQPAKIEGIKNIIRQATNKLKSFINIIKDNIKGRNDQITK